MEKIAISFCFQNWFYIFYNNLQINFNHVTTPFQVYNQLASSASKRPHLSYEEKIIEFEDPSLVEKHVEEG